MFSVSLHQAALVSPTSLIHIICFSIGQEHRQLCVAATFTFVHTNIPVPELPPGNGQIGNRPDRIPACMTLPSSLLEFSKGASDSILCVPCF